MLNGCGPGSFRGGGGGKPVLPRSPLVCPRTESEPSLKRADPVCMALCQMGGPPGTAGGAREPALVSLDFTKSSQQSDLASSHTQAESFQNWVSDGFPWPGPGARGWT